MRTTKVKPHSRSCNMKAARQELRAYENMTGEAELRALSKHSLEHPLTDRQYKRMMELAKKFNVQSGKVPTLPSLESDDARRRAKLQTALNKGIDPKLILKGTLKEAKEHPEMTQKQAEEIAIDHLLKNRFEYSEPPKYTKETFQLGDVPDAKVTIYKPTEEKLPHRYLVSGKKYGKQRIIGHYRTMREAKKAYNKHIFERGWKDYGIGDVQLEGGKEIRQKDF